MGRRRIAWQLTSSLVLALLVFLAISAWYLQDAARTLIREEATANVTRCGSVIANVLAGAMSGETQFNAADWGPRVERRGIVSVVIVDSDGRVLYDRESVLLGQASVVTRSESMLAALDGRVGAQISINSTSGNEYVRLTMPIKSGPRVLGAIGMSRKIDLRSARTLGFVKDVMGVGLVVILIGMVVAIMGIHRLIIEPLSRLRVAVDRITSGESNWEKPVIAGREFAELADSLNHMADRLVDQIGVVQRQSEHSRTILASMVEGVIAVDLEGRILLANEAAARLVGVDIADVAGKRVYEVIRNSDIQRLLRETQEAGEETTCETTFGFSPDIRFVHAAGSKLASPDGRVWGVVVVLHDVTQIRRLEDMRQQFVTNVSHELKTPITAIKAAVETLIDELCDESDDPMLPENRFTAIILRQADRLSAIIDDLLSLARIEQDSKDETVELEPGRVLPILDAAVETCVAKSQPKGVELVVECPQSLEIHVNAPLFEQALVNLMDNAIKYSPDAGTVLIVAQVDQASVSISVSDTGCGIEAKHLPRLFERFYRTDKARSRKLGGTGLGLAIVKHIVQAHRGHMKVESKVGSGSTFTMVLPGVPGRG